MSQSRFSIVLVGVSALLRRPLVLRLRPADGERSSWVVFAARRCLPLRRLPLGGLAFGLTASAFRHAPFRSCRSAGWPSGSLLPLFGTHRFGVAVRRIGSSAFRFGNCPRRVGLRAHRFRFSARTASEIAAGRVRSFVFRFGVAVRRVGLRTHCFRFSACANPHRRTAEARTDGAHRHDNCFTSKHLSQHVNLPHRTP